MYFGSTIMTFALPYGAFIVGALALFFLFRARHSGPRLKYLQTSDVASVTTREPGPAPAPSMAAEAEAKAEAEAQPAAAAAPAAENTDRTDSTATTESTEGEE
jgi:cytoskeletal protein RodZ